MSNNTDPTGGDPSSSDGGDPSGGFVPLDDGIIIPIQALVGQAAAEGLVTGITVLLTAQAMYSVVGRGLKGSTPRILTLAALLSMLASSLLTFSVDISICLLVLTEIGTHPTPGMLLSRLVVVSKIFTRFNFIIGDIIVASRAWILAKNTAIRICLAATVIITFGCYIAESVLAGKEAFSQPDGDEIVSHTFIQTVPLLFTNALSTAIIAYMAWSYRAQIKVHLHHQTRKGQVERVLFLLMESGFLYCVVWILQILLNAEIGISLVAEQIVGSIIPYLATIYPTAIILLVARGKVDELVPSPGDAESSMKFASRRNQPQGHSIVQSMADGHLDELHTSWNTTTHDPDGSESTHEDESQKTKMPNSASTIKVQV